MREFLIAITAAVIGAVVSFAIFYAQEKFNFETDFQATTIELQSAKDNIQLMISDKEMEIPKYKVLNMQLDWKKTLLNYNNENLNILYNRLNRLDSLREVILQENDTVNRRLLNAEYYEIMNEIINKKMIDNGVEFIKERS